MRTDADDPHRLSQLAPMLRAEGWETQPYYVLWQAALNGRFPAEQVRGRWHFKPRDIPAIARALRLRRRTGAKPEQSEASVIAA